MAQHSELANYGKAYACLLVLIGHVILGIENAGIPVFGAFTAFREVIWTIHIPVFLYLSGYVFALGGFSAGKGGKLSFLKKKLLTLGVPYVVFSAVYVCINTLSGSANHQNGLTDLLMIWKTPVAQYWYLYTLFFLFAFWVLLEGLLPPVFIALAAVGIGYLPTLFSVPLGPFEDVFSCALPFVAGALLPLPKIDGLPKWAKAGVVLFHAAASVLFVTQGWLNLPVLKELIYMLGVVASICLVSLLGEIPAVSRFLSFVCRHSFPIYLTHTIFTAGIRVVLLRFGFTNAVLHTVLGILCGFVFPWLISVMSEHYAPLHFLFYPKWKKKAKQ